MASISPNTQDLPPQIIEAIDNGKLAIFIGAGISRLVGCKGWRHLAQEYIELCVKNSLIDYKDKDTLGNFSDNRKIITIAYELLKERHADEFHGIMRQALLNGEEKKEPIYDDILKLSPLIITTNADNFLHQYYSPDRIESQEFHSSKIDKTRLFKIHGSIDDKKSLIFTLPSYFERYSEKSFQEFLIKLFTEYNILFIGYGLAEFELLEFLFSKATARQPREMRHFILLGFFQGEEAKLKLESLYYKSLGIDIIPYSKNKNGYLEMANIFKHWAREVNTTTSIVPNSISDLDDCFIYPHRENINKAIQIITHNQPASDYFWQNISVKDAKGKFLQALFEGDQFSPLLIPTQKEEPPGSGKYYIKLWMPLEYLKTVANSASTSSSELKIIRKIVDNLINYWTENPIKLTERNRLVDWKLSVLICLLPLKTFSDKHIKYLREIALWSDNFMVSNELEIFLLNRVIPKGDDSLLNKILKLVFTTYKKKEGEFRIEALVQAHSIENIVQGLVNKLTSRQNRIVLEFAVAKIRMHKANGVVFSTIYINTIEESRQNFITDKYEYSLVRLVRNSLLEISDRNVTSIVSGMLRKSKDQIYKRIAFYLINQRFKTLKGILWKWPKNPLDEESCKHELYELLRSNAPNFSKKEAKIILNWIREINDRMHKNKTSEWNQIYRAITQKEWLSALNNAEFILIEEVKQLIKELDKVTPEKREHPGYYTYSSYSSGIDSPPVSNPVWNEDNLSISNFILNPLKWDGYNKSGITQKLKDTLQQNPKSRSANLKAFDILSLEYKQEIVYSFYNSASQGKDFDVDSVLAFVKRAMAKSDFWKQVSGQSWFIDSFSWLTKEVLRNDFYVISETSLIKIESLLLTLMEHTISDTKLRNKDFITDIINSTKAKLFESWLHVNLKKSRFATHETANKWMPASFAYINRIIINKKRDIEFQFLLGAFLPNLSFLNPQWVEAKFDLMFPMEDPINWNFGFSSYLYFTGQVYTSMYNLFREKKHLDFALKFYKEEGNSTDRLVQQICVMYNAGVENIEDDNSLISKVITNRNISQIKYLISFYLYLDNPVLTVVPLWEKLMFIAEDLPNHQQIEMHTQLVLWLEVVPQITDFVVMWILKSLEYISEKVDFRLMQTLTSRFHEAPEQIGLIYEHLVDQDKENNFKREDDIKLVEGLYSMGLTATANNICLKSMAKSDFTFKEIYDKNSKNLNI